MSVTLEIQPSNIGVLTINRPHVRNALDWDAMDSFRECIETAHEDSKLRALILTGGGNAFIAGGDLRALHENTSQKDGIRLSGVMTNALNRLEALPFPVIAAINGPARGGGAEIALACDFRIVAQDTTFGFVQINLGLSPGWGAGQRLLHIVGYSHALEILMTGRILDANEMQTLGLANRITPKGQALIGAMDLAKEISKKPANAIKALKRMLRTGISTPRSTAELLEQSEFPPLWNSEEHILAVEQFLNRKKKSEE
ncbi:MAG TPA: enoyl-CoA hydratase/isomerase family protein [Anaerolineae bacterium]|nr:enoyl-CoA hydratase/isomerase family protein [Anaerolineae bacterium]